MKGIQNIESVPTLTYALHICSTLCPKSYWFGLTYLATRLYKENMKLNFKRLLLLSLVLQWSVVPVVQASVAHGHPASESDKEISQTDIASVVVPGAHMLQGQVHCDDEHGINGRCTKCLCINIVVFPSAFSFEHISVSASFLKIPKPALNQIYLESLFRPPIFKSLAL